MLHCKGQGKGQCKGQGKGQCKGQSVQQEGPCRACCSVKVSVEVSIKGSGKGDPKGSVKGSVMGSVKGSVRVSVEVSVKVSIRSHVEGVTGVHLAKCCQSRAECHLQKGFAFCVILKEDVYSVEPSHCQSFPYQHICLSTTGI